MVTRLKFALSILIASLTNQFHEFQYQLQGMTLALTPPSLRTNMAGKLGGSSYKKTLGEIILFVLILFIVFLFATSGIIANSNIQTQLKNGAYYGGLFASVVVILIVLAFIL